MSNLISASILSALSSTLTASPQNSVESYSPTEIFTNGSIQMVQTQENPPSSEQYCATNANASPGRGTGRREW